VIEVRDELRAVVLVALEFQIEAPRDPAQRVHEMALHTRRLVREAIADVLGLDDSVDDGRDLASVAVIRIEVRLVVRAD
jgi:hypothetical protein